MKNYKRLGDLEREEISHMLSQKCSFRNIAKVLYRNVRTISREINAGSCTKYSYRAVKAQNRAMRNSSKRKIGRHKLFTDITGVKIYFAHPRSPWERGTNENTNGLIRQFFPKGTDFNKISRYEVKKVQDLLNGRPRAALNFQKPYEVFN